MLTATVPGAAVHYDILERIPIPCGCGCGLPAAHIIIREGRLAVEIENRHHGSVHRTVLTLKQIGCMIMER